jgi:hypothetical protein
VIAGVRWAIRSPRQRKLSPIRTLYYFLPAIDEVLTTDLELLSTIHWVAGEDQRVHSDPDAAVQGVQGWSAHKRRAFQADHIKVAWKRLYEERWIGTGN